MELKPMKILVVEDDINDCKRLKDCERERDDIEIVAMTDSDIDALKYVKAKNPEGIILDLELNNSKNGSTDSLELLNKIKELKLAIDPIIIVTTHVNSKRTYDILHRNGVDLILYKDHPNYSPNNVFNKFLSLRKTVRENMATSIEEEFKNRDENIIELVNHELDLIGITPNLKGRDYIRDSIIYLIQNDGDAKVSVTQYLTKIYKKAPSTINNGIQNAITHAWNASAIEDLEKYYTARINYKTGIPTANELIYYYVDKIKKMI